MALQLLRIAAMVPRLQCPPLLEIRPAKASKALIKMLTFSSGEISFSDQYFSDSDLEYYSGSPRRRRRRSPPLTRKHIKNWDLCVHKDYDGLLLLCCYVTQSLDSKEGGPHDFTLAILMTL